MVAAWPLTARGACLERLGHFYADQAVGGVVLTGPAGVGKTRLGEEALRAAASAGRPTVRAVGHPATQSIPLGALAHMLSVDVARDVGIGLGDDDRAVLFHGARASLTEQAAGQRLLLMVDDIDQLDETSLALLLPLMIDRTVFLIATIRTGLALPAVVASLVKDGHVTLERLPTLTRDEVVTLLHRVLDGPVDTLAVDKLAAISEGNLQVLREIVLQAREQGVLCRNDGVWRLTGLPTSGPLEDLVVSHLADLDADAQRMLEMLAVAGTVGLADLDQFADRGVLEDLEERGFINVIVDRRRTNVTLAHPLYGEVMRARLPVLRQRALQRLHGDRLEAHGARRREDVTQLALARLEGGGDVDTIVLINAGRLAVVGRDSALALRFAAAAAERGFSHEAARIAVEAAVLAADADAVENAVAAVWDDGALPDGHRAHLARRLATTRLARGDLAGALAVVEEADSLVAEAPAVAAIRAQRAYLLASTGRPQEALRVLADVADVDDARVRIELASARSIACLSVGRFEEAIVAARSGARTQGELPAWVARRGMAAHLVNEAHALAYGGLFREARKLVERALPTAQAAGALAAQVWFELALGEIERDAGYGHAAVARFSAATLLARQAGQHAALVWALVGIAQGHLLLGDGDAAAAALAEADEAGDSPIATSWSTRERARAWLLACQGDLVGARALLAKVAASVDAAGILPLEAGLLHDLVRFGDPDAAADRLQELALIVDGPLVDAMALHARAAVGTDLAAYDEAIAGFEAMDCVVLAAETMLEAAELHRRNGNQRPAAALSQRAAQLIARSGGARTPPLLRGDSTEPLTAREREVALLASAGVPSKDIAARLFVSKRTVDSHLERVYRKMGITGRDQLGAALGATGSAT